PNVRVQVGVFAAADRVDEILVMVGRAIPFFDLLALFVVRDRTAVIRDEYVAAFAFDHDRDAAALVFVHVLGAGLFRQAAHFEDQGRFLVTVIDDLGVRRLGVVLITEP